MLEAQGESPALLETLRDDAASGLMRRKTAPERLKDCETLLKLVKAAKANNRSRLGSLLQEAMVRLFQATSTVLIEKEADTRKGILLTQTQGLGRQFLADHPQLAEVLTKEQEVRILNTPKNKNKYEPVEIGDPDGLSPQSETSVEGMIKAAVTLQTSDSKDINSIFAFVA
jgi:hypothetical protein